MNNPVPGDDHQPEEPQDKLQALTEAGALSGFEDLLSSAPTGGRIGDDSEDLDDSTLPEPSGGPRRRRGALIALSLLVVALVGAGVATAVLLARDDGADSGPRASSSAAKPQLDLRSPGVFDSFARPAGSLGTADSGQEWQQVAGRWGIDDANACVVEPSPSGPSIALVNMRASDGIVQATMPSPERAAGLVFRYDSPLNHWTMTAAPGSATWVVTKTEAGQSETVATLGTSPGGDNVTIAVQFIDDELAFFVDGVERTSLADPFLSDARRVGMIARGSDDVTAKWTNFVAIALTE